MVELRAVAAGTFALSYAGDVYNTAVYLKRSLPEAHVQFLTATGDDTMSRGMREQWAAQEVDDSLAFTVRGGSPGLYLIETDALGERHFHYWRNDSAARNWLTMLQAHGESSLWGADIVYLSGITLAILSEAERPAAVECLGRLRSHVGHIALDPNMRLALWSTRQTAASIIGSAISTCDIALPSTEDLKSIFDVDHPVQQLDLLQRMGVREVALTLGANGCAIADGPVRTQLPAPTVDILIDTSGAGDAFNGAYLAGRLLGDSPLRAAEAGLVIAARVVTHSGAIVPACLSHPPAP
jgi:2-dehydro-3-deoxygluconokinase